MGTADYVRKKFLLTHPVWDVTAEKLEEYFKQLISTHTSRVGCDQFLPGCSRQGGGFLLTHPVWDVTFLSGKAVRPVKFLLTHPVWDVTASSFICAS